METNISPDHDVARPDTSVRLKAPRPSFALDMSDEEREMMGRRAAHWQPLGGFVRPS